MYTLFNIGNIRYRSLDYSSIYHCAFLGGNASYIKALNPSYVDLFDSSTSGMLLNYLCVIDRELLLILDYYHIDTGKNVVHYLALYPSVGKI